MKICKHKECTTAANDQEFAKSAKAKDGLQPYCKACKARIHQEYKAKPGIAEKLSANSAKHAKTAKGKACRAAYKKTYRASVEGKATEAASKKAYRESIHGKEIEAASRKAYNESEEGKAKNKAYWKTPKGREVIRVSNNKRRDLLSNTSDGSITADSLEALKVSQPGCFYCNEPLDFEAANGAHLDHYIPLSKGGANVLLNVVWSCPHCNQSKGAKMPEEFLKEQKWKN